MTIQSYRMGPGTLSLDAQDASGQVTNCRIEWDESVQSTDAIPVLSGEELATDDDVTYGAKLLGNVVQDIDAAGLVAFTWTHRGQEVDFVFVPADSEGRQVTGVVRIIPLTLGGDVKKRNQADFTWVIIGDPSLGDTD